MAFGGAEDDGGVVQDTVELQRRLHLSRDRDCSHCSFGPVCKRPQFECPAMTERADDAEASYDLLPAKPALASEERVGWCCGVCRCRRRTAHWIVAVSVAAGLLLVFGIYDRILRLGDNRTPLIPIGPAAIIHPCPWLPNATTTAPTRLPGAPLRPPAMPSATVVFAEDAAICWEPVADPGSVNYTLQRTEWWNQTGSGSCVLDSCFETVYQGPDTFANLTLLLPSANYSLRVRAEDWVANETSPWSPLLSLTTLIQGRCGNPADLTMMRDHYAEFKGDIQLAMIECAFSADPEGCTINNLHASLGLSDECGMCWVAEGQCTLANCVFQCLDPSSAACVECSHEKCFPGAVACTGIPMWRFPP